MYFIQYTKVYMEQASGTWKYQCAHLTVNLTFSVTKSCLLSRSNRPLNNAVVQRSPLSPKYRLNVVWARVRDIGADPVAAQALSTLHRGFESRPGDGYFYCSFLECRKPTGKKDIKLTLMYQVAM